MFHLNRNDSHFRYVNIVRNGAQNEQTECMNENESKSSTGRIRLCDAHFTLCMVNTKSICNYFIAASPIFGGQEYDKIKTIK